MTDTISTNNIASRAVLCGQAGLAWRLQLLGVSIQACVIVAAVIPLLIAPQQLSLTRGIAASVLGLGLYTTTPIVLLFSTTISNLTRVEQRMISVERLVEYIKVLYFHLIIDSTGR